MQDTLEKFQQPFPVLKHGSEQMNSAANTCITVTYLPESIKWPELQNISMLR